MGVGTCGELFADRSDLAHFTSAIRYPLFVDRANYSGSPSIVADPWLSDLAARWFGQEVGLLRDALFVPLGPKVEDVLLDLGRRGEIEQGRILAGLPHPSGANAERVAYFLGRKAQSALSAKTRADPIDQARERLLAQLRAMR